MPEHPDFQDVNSSQIPLRFDRHRQFLTRDVFLLADIIEVRSSVFEVGTDTSSVERISGPDARVGAISKEATRESDINNGPFFGGDHADEWLPRCARASWCACTGSDLNDL
jgi:hypothetical protein